MRHTPSIPTPRVSPAVSAAAGGGRSSSGRMIALAGGAATGPDASPGGRP